MLDSPKQIGAYSVERELGRGGMGVVYLAKDPRLDRHVAIKVLPDVVARDPERLARFEREARLLASLKHPNIGGIHGLEEADGQRFLVLEYLEGETLATRLKSGTLRSSEAIHICAQIAAALEAAHERGVIHRDLKPSNVMLSADDEVKVFDFGLARGDGGMAESSSDLSASPTVTVGATAVGVVLGTAAYMSPEQARGKPVDRRTDIWSFGCVLYECLTGRQLFGGETVSDTIAKILEREPDWNALPSETPDRVRELLRRCLQRKARERLRDMGDARIELEEVASGKTSGISGVSTVALEHQYKGRLRVAWTVAAVAGVLAIAGFFGTFIFRPAPAAQDLVRFDINPKPRTFMTGLSDNVAISPDGSRIVFEATDSLGVRMLWLRELASLETKPIPGTRDGFMPFWAPDSRAFAFFSDRKLRRLSFDGGEPQVLCDAPAARGGSWGKEWIVFAGTGGPIFKVPASGGTPEAVTAVDSSAGDASHRFPCFLPDGQRFMFAALPERKGLLRIYVGHVDGRQPVRLMESAGRPAYTKPGFLVFRSGLQIVAQPFDAQRLQLSGSATAFGRSGDKSSTIGAPAISVSSEGRIVHPAARLLTSELVRYDMTGRPIEKLDVEEGYYWNPRVSPDGRYVAYHKEVSPEEADIWIYEFDRKVATRFTFGPGRNVDPRWSPDGQSILFASDRDGATDLYVQSVNGGQARRLPQSPSSFKNPMCWSPDGKYVIYSQAGANSGMDLWLAPVEEGGEATPLFASRFGELFADVSPDGKWVTYESNESGASEVYITSFPVPGRKYRVSNGGGYGPVWSHDGRTVSFLSPGLWLMISSVQTQPEIRAGTPRRLFQLDPAITGAGICPDDECFVAAVLGESQSRNRLTVIDGWQSLIETH